ncbi:MAG: divergent polysaccharide deacetylase family protein [Rhodospirillales bacterium]|nr:divergent polysaccharide deacetylase family protein [Rhodospirillales bacterium]
MADKKLDDDEDDDDDLEAGPAESNEGRPAHDDDEPALSEDDEDEPKRGGKGKLIAIVAVAATLVIAMAGGAYVFMFSGSDEEETAQASVAKDEPDDGSTMIISRNRRMISSEEMAKQGITPEAPSASTTPGTTALTPPTSTARAPSQPQAAAQGTSQAAPADSAAPAPLAALAPQGPAQAPASGPAKGAKGKAAPTTPDTQGLVTPAATAAAYRDIPVLPAGKPLSPPDPQYGESSDFGTLPRARGSQGVWKAYARPFDGPTDKPRVTIIVTGLGLSRASTLAAISQTPAGVTLAFDPYTRNLDEWLGLGRSNGHEALVQLPMEPSDFPISDPGPLALLTDLDATQNIQRLHQVLASATGYTGVIQVMGSKFAASEAALRPALDEMKRRGVLFVSVPSGSEDRGFSVAQDAGVPSARVDLKLDTELTAAAIDDRISELERLAREKGRAIGIAEAYPVTLARLSIWGQTLSLKEITLAPASAIVQIAAPAPATKGGAAKH